MADANSVSPGLATLGAGGWTVTEPSAGGRFGSVGVLTPQQTLATQALVSGAGIGGAGLRTVLFGHSYFDRETISGTGVWNAFSAAGTVVWANALLGHPLQIIKEYALGGYRLLDLMPRYKAEVEGVYRPQVLFVCIGHNDLKGLFPSGGAGQPFGQVGADPRQVELPYLLARWDQFLRDEVNPTTRVFVLGENPPGRNGLDVQSAATSKQLAVRYL
ncbi:MAG TPA: SGNH/GDSL hydrolase family protein, partial [Burkholderiaceae bacterium]|nr:SGNH/GDSL hydrolase family protein [Burkholderiaceae bacterium]